MVGSEAPRGADNYGIDSQAQAVRNALDALGVRHAVLVGHSMGGFVALALARAGSPNVLSESVISDTPAEMSLAAMPALAGLACAPVIGAAIDRLRPVDAISDSSLQTGFADDYAVPPLGTPLAGAVDARRACVTPANQDGEPAAVDRIAELGQPVLVVWGERDVLTPTAANVERYREAGLTPTVIPECRTQSESSKRQANSSTPSPNSSGRQAPRDDQALNLVGALEDLGDLGLPHVALDAVVAGVARRRRTPARHRW